MSGKIRFLLSLCSFVLFFGCSAPHQPSPYLTAQNHVTPSTPQARPKPLSPVPSQQPSQPKKKEGIVVFLDPGHGGRDGGAAVRASHVQEKTLALEIAKRVERLLKSWGYIVVMSRRQDVAVPLQRRVEMASQNNAAVFVSIHFNSASSRKSRGAEIYYFNKSGSSRAGESKRLGTCILRRLCEALPTQHRGVKHGNFCVVRETRMPAVLVEAAFITNPKELRLLTSPPYKQQIAAAMAKGIDDYFCRKE